MKILLKIMFFVFAIFQTNISEAKVFVFAEVVTQIRFIENAIENKNEVTTNSVNGFVNTCKSESDLVDYRNLMSVAKATAAKGGLVNSRALGIAGEQAVGVGSKTRIPSLTGTAKYRIPDQLTSTTLGEVKNVSHLSLTRQLTDFH
jgi:hypothetical protein